MEEIKEIVTSKEKFYDLEKANDFNKKGNEAYN
jgi:hypothetical protein